MKRKIFLIVSVSLVILIVACGFGLKDNKEYLIEEYKCEDKLFGQLDNYEIELYEEWVDIDIGEFTIFYKYTEFIYSDSSGPYTRNIYYLAYNKVSNGVYIVSGEDDYSFSFTPLLDPNTRRNITYEDYKEERKNETE